MNKKGFSLVELLGTITIMGILMGLAITAYSRYINGTRKKAYETLVQSSISAMEEYIVDHPTATTVTINDLYEKDYLERPTDPSSSENICDGKVTRTTTGAGGESSILPDENYTVVLCCINYNYTFPNNGKDTPIKNDTCQK